MPYCLEFCLLIEVFSKRLNPAERAKVDTVVLDIQYSNKLQRMWTQFKAICDEQVTLHRLHNPQNFPATAAASINISREPYCFGCVQNHSDNPDTRLLSTQNARTQSVSNTMVTHCYFQKASP